MVIYQDAPFFFFSLQLPSFLSTLLPLYTLLSLYTLLLLAAHSRYLRFSSSITLGALAHPLPPFANSSSVCVC
jgi:hypothetical protein